MTLEAHIEELSSKHRELDRRIREVINSPGTDDLTIAELKRRKLRLKEQILKLQQG